MNEHDDADVSCKTESLSCAIFFKKQKSVFNNILRDIQ
jgi:hypothetical protein